MKTHKFVRKPIYVDAVRVSENNFEEVAKWCDGEIVDGPDGRYIQVKVHRPAHDRQTQAFLSDWVLASGNGYKVYTTKAFDRSFDKVKTLTKEQADAAGIKPPHEPKKYSKKQADAKGIKVPHEKSQRPKPAPPKRGPREIGTPVLTEEQAKKFQELPVEEPAPLEEKSAEMQMAADAVFVSEEVKPEPAKDEVDLLIDEVMRQPQPGDQH